MYEYDRNYRNNNKKINIINNLFEIKDLTY